MMRPRRFGPRPGDRRPLRGPTPAGAPRQDHHDDAPGPQVDPGDTSWSAVAAYVAALDISDDGVAEALRLCMVLARAEAQDLAELGVWKPVAPARVYEALRAYRDRVPLERWTASVAMPLVEGFLPEGTTLRDAMTGYLLPEGRAIPTAMTSVRRAAAWFFFATAWLTHRLDGTPGLQQAGIEALAPLLRDE